MERRRPSPLLTSLLVAVMAILSTLALARAEPAVVHAEGIVITMSDLASIPALSSHRDIDAAFVHVAWQIVALLVLGLTLATTARRQFRSAPCTLFLRGPPAR
jgi:hypothetical protein